MNAKLYFVIALANFLIIINTIDNDKKDNITLTDNNFRLSGH